ncbi:hypothetical protein BC831DRAFT_476000 [Entophlyctis helioformis]|nr:hypothetical protein BC831DRAFT_476000 [Entophlyctis helioformis]
MPVAVERRKQPADRLLSVAVHLDHRRLKVQLAVAASLGVLGMLVGQIREQRRIELRRQRHGVCAAMQNVGERRHLDRAGADADVPEPQRVRKGGRVPAVVRLRRADGRRAQESVCL